MRIGILGASGVIGHALVPLLRQSGAQVRTAGRRPERMPAADEFVFTDILQPQTLSAAVEDLDAVINLAKSVPDGKGRGSWAENDRICLAGTRNLVDALRASNPDCRLIQQSVAMLHQGSKLVDEYGELVGEGVLCSAIAMEATVQSSGLDWVIIRGSALYGPGTARDSRFFRSIAEGLLRPPLQRARWITFVHLNDLASAFAQAPTLPGGQAYIAADDRPMTYRQMFDAIRGDACWDGCVVPAMQALPSFRVHSERLRGLGWCPIHQDALRFAGASATTMREAVLA